MVAEVAKSIVVFATILVASWAAGALLCAGAAALSWSLARRSRSRLSLNG